MVCSEYPLSLNGKQNSIIEHLTPGSSTFSYSLQSFVPREIRTQILKELASRFRLSSSQQVSLQQDILHLNVTLCFDSVSCHICSVVSYHQLLYRMTKQTQEVISSVCQGKFWDMSYLFLLI